MRRSLLARRVYQTRAVNDWRRKPLTEGWQAWLLAACVLASACNRQPKLKSYELVVHVESDPNRPLAGAKLLHAGVTLGTSGAEGRVAIRATGNEGERLDLEVLCPTGYHSPEAPLSVTLRHGATAGERPEYVLACPPTTRKLVVAARLEHGENLPIRYLGRELSRSDASGVAHMLLEAETDKTVELTIDTSERPLLRPKSPTARFRIGDRDDVVVLAQSFQNQKTQSGPRRSSGPVRIR